MEKGDIIIHAVAFFLSLLCFAHPPIYGSGVNMATIVTNDFPIVRAVIRASNTMISATIQRSAAAASTGAVIEGRREKEQVFTW